MYCMLLHVLLFWEHRQLSSRTGRGLGEVNMTAVSHSKCITVLFRNELYELNVITLC